MVEEDSIQYQKRISAGFNRLRDYLLKTSYEHFLQIDREYTDITQEKVLLFLEKKEQDTYDNKGKTVADEESELIEESNNSNEQTFSEDSESGDGILDSQVQKENDISTAEELSWDQEKYNRFSANYFINERKNNNKSNLEKLSLRYLIRELKDFKKNETKKLNLIHIKLFFHHCMNINIFNSVKDILSDEPTKYRLVNDFSKYADHSKELFDAYLNNSDFEQFLESLNDKQDNKSNVIRSGADNCIKSSLLKTILSFLNSIEKNDSDLSDRINFSIVRYDFITIVLFRFLFFKLSHETFNVDKLHLYIDALIESKGNEFDDFVEDFVPNLVIKENDSKENYKIKDLYFIFLLLCENARPLYRKCEIEFVQKYIFDNYDCLTNPLVSEAYHQENKKSRSLDYFACMHGFYKSNNIQYVKNYRHEYIMFLIHLCFKSLEEYGFSVELIKDKYDELFASYKKYEFAGMSLSAPLYYRYEIEKQHGKPTYMLKYTVSNEYNLAKIIINCDITYIVIEISFENCCIEIAQHK